GIAFVHPLHALSVIRIQERETGFFEDLEVLLERIVPGGIPNRERLVCALLSPRSEQVPFADGVLALGRFQRIMMFSLDAEHRSEWSLTLLG
ncbi:MAG: YjbQ family protein, partial [Actinobacteria bacterium]|nr:YjbQ family protein [Actinomycetota bacterium]